MFNSPNKNLFILKVVSLNNGFEYGYKMVSSYFVGQFFWICFLPVTTRKGSKHIKETEYPLLVEYR